MDRPPILVKGTNLDIVGELIRIWVIEDLQRYELIRKYLDNYHDIFLQTCPPTEKCLAVGVKCIVKIPSSLTDASPQIFQRATIQAVSRSTVSVLLVDYGCSVTIDHMSVRLYTMNDEGILMIPDQAHNYIVANAFVRQPVSQAVLQQLKDDIYGQTLHLQFVQSDIGLQLARPFRDQLNLVQLWISYGSIEYIHANSQEHYIQTHFLPPATHTSSSPKTPPPPGFSWSPPQRRVFVQPQVRPTTMSRQQQMESPTAAYVPKVESQIVKPVRNTLHDVIDIEAITKQVKAELAKEKQEATSKRQCDEASSPTFISPAEPLPLDSTHPVVVTNITNGPWAFFIHLHADLLPIAQLQDSLSIVPKEPVPVVYIGKYCLVESFGGRKCCRAVVLSQSQNGIHVHLVDYGKDENVDQIYQLPTKFMKRPSFARQFSLTSLSKLQSRSPEEVAALKEHFAKLLLGTDSVVLKVRPHETHSIQYCELYINARNIKDILNEIMGSIPYDFTAEPFPETGSQVRVTVTWVEGPSRIFVQLCQNTNSILSLCEEVDEYAKVVEPFNLSEVKLKMPCIALFKDGHWYRATVLKKSGEAITVFFVDYGNLEVVGPKELKPINTHLLKKISAQALKCCIKNFNGDTNELNMISDMEHDIIVRSTDKDRMLVQFLNVNFHQDQTNAHLKLKNDISVNTCEDGNTPKNDGPGKSKRGSRYKSNNTAYKSYNNTVKYNNRWEDDEKMPTERFGQRNRESYFAGRSSDMKTQTNGDFNDKNKFTHGSDRNFETSNKRNENENDGRGTNGSYYDRGGFKRSGNSDNDPEKNRSSQWRGSRNDGEKSDGDFKRGGYKKFDDRNDGGEFKRGGGFRKFDADTSDADFKRGGARRFDDGNDGDFKRGGGFRKFDDGNDGDFKRGGGFKKFEDGNDGDFSKKGGFRKFEDGNDGDFPKRGGFRKFDDGNDGDFPKRGGGFRKFEDGNDGDFPKRGGGFRKFEDGNDGDFPKRGGGFRKFEDGNDGDFPKRGGGFRKFEDGNDGDFPKRGGGFRKFEDGNDGDFKRGGSRKFDDGNDKDFKRGGGGFKKFDDDDNWNSSKNSFKKDAGKSNWESKRSNSDDWRTKGDHDDVFKKGGFGSFEDSNGDGGKRPFKKFGNEDGDFKRGDRGDRPKVFRLSVRDEDRVDDDFQLRPPEMPIDSTHSVCATYFVTPEDFYLQLQESKDEFSQMMSDIQTEYANKFSCRDPPKEGTLVVAKYFDDGVLYRAEIIKNSPVEVRFLDYGNIEEIRSLRDIYPLMRKFADLPRQTIRCKLEGIKPIGDQWTDSGISEKFSQADVMNCTIKSSDNLDILTVQLSVNGVDLVKQLIDDGLVAPSEILEAPSSSDKTFSKIAYSLLPGQTILADVVFINGVDKFFVHLLAKEVEQLQQLVAAYQERKLLNPSDLKQNMYFLGSNDGETFYRAKVVEMGESGPYAQFIDYGDCSNVPYEQVFALPESLSVDVIPALATECYLLGDTTDVLDDAQDSFKEFFEGTPLLLCVDCEDSENQKLAVTPYKVEDGTKIKVQNWKNSLPEKCPLRYEPIWFDEISVDVINFAGDDLVSIKLPNSSSIELNLESAESISIDDANSDELLGITTENGCARVLLSSDKKSVLLVDEGQTIDAPAELKKLSQNESLAPVQVRKVRAKWPIFGLNKVRVSRDDLFCIEPSVKEVYISHIESMQKVFVQPQCIQTVLEEINNAAMECISDKNVIWSVGDTLFAKYPADESWNRAKVLDVIEDGTLKITFIDYGNEATVQEMAKLPERIQNIPPLAVCVSFGEEYFPEHAADTLEKLNTTFFKDPLVLVENGPNTIDLLYKNRRSVAAKLRGQSKQPALQVGDAVVISHADAPEELYLRRNCDDDVLDKITNDLASGETLEEIDDDTMEGDLLVAQFVDDELWYRGVRLSDNRIYFVDYGNHVPDASVKELPSHLMEIPPLAYKCSLIVPSTLSQSITVERILEFVDQGLKIEAIELIDGVPGVKLSIQGEDLIAKLLEDNESSPADEEIADHVVDRSELPETDDDKSNRTDRNATDEEKAGVGSPLIGDGFRSDDEKREGQLAEDPEELRPTEAISEMTDNPQSVSGDVTEEVVYDSDKEGCAYEAVEFEENNTEVKFSIEKDLVVETDEQDDSAQHIEVAELEKPTEAPEEQMEVSKISENDRSEKAEFALKNDTAEVPTKMFHRVEEATDRIVAEREISKIDECVEDDKEIVNSNEGDEPIKETSENEEMKCSDETEPIVVEECSTNEISKPFCVEVNNLNPSMEPNEDVINIKCADQEESKSDKWDDEPPHQNTVPLIVALTNPTQENSKEPIKEEESKVASKHAKDSLNLSFTANAEQSKTCDISQDDSSPVVVTPPLSMFRMRTPIAEKIVPGCVRGEPTTDDNN